MSNTYSVAELFSFLDHAAERGLLPAATAQALAVAGRHVFGVLTEDEKGDVRHLDLDAIRRRFQNKRARDFSTDTLREYDRRVRRAVKLFLEWRDDPGNFRPATRATSAARRRRNATESDVVPDSQPPQMPTGPVATSPGAYQTALPLGPGRIVTLTNVPADLTAAEAERLASFVRMLAVGPEREP